MSRCIGFTKNNKRCMNNAIKKTGYNQRFCYQHQSQKDAYLFPKIITATLINSKLPLYDNQKKQIINVNKSLKKENSQRNLTECQKRAQKCDKDMQKVDVFCDKCDNLGRFVNSMWSHPLSRIRYCRDVWSGEEIPGTKVNRDENFDQWINLSCKKFEKLDKPTRKSK